MNILELIAGNWARGPQTQRYPDQPAMTGDYRGRVEIDPTVCVTCGICAQVCVSAAIEVRPAEASATWAYDPASCTFCGACVIHCPVAALAQAPDRGECSHHADEHAAAVTVEYPRCPACNAATLPTHDNLLTTAFGERAPQMRDRARLCERCRLRASVQGMKKAFGGLADTETIRSGHGR